MDPPEAKHNQRKFDAIEQLEKVAADAGVSLTASRDRVEHRAPGRHVDDHRPKTMDQLDDLLGAADVTLDSRRSTASTRSCRPAARCTPPTTATNHPSLAGGRPADADPNERPEDTTHGTRRLGRTALRVSELCLGTMNFGPLTTQDDSFVIMDRALDLGINFFDTANRYGGPKGPGTTETIVGNWFAQGGGRREKVVLATKVFGPMTDWPNDGGLSARHIRDACEASLRRLQTDHIDLYQMHHVDRNAPWEEIWQAMEKLVDQGKVIYVGSSNFAGWHIAQANEAAAAPQLPRSRQRAESVQPGVATVELEVLPACRGYGLAVIPWSPLAGGMLGGIAGSGDTARRKSPNPALRGDAPAAREVGEVLRRARRGAGCGRARVVAAAPRGHRTDHRPARSSSSKVRHCEPPRSSSTTTR